MSLFENGEFTSHSGLKLTYKINCDHLTDADWETLASLVASRIDFSKVIGVPQGGLKFAAALEKYAKPTSSMTLIVDDVLTTGKSLLEERGKLGAVPSCAVIVFSRAKIHPYWVYPIFRLSWPFFDDAKLG